MKPTWFLTFKVFIALFWIGSLVFLIVAGLESRRGIIYHFLNDFVFQGLFILGICSIFISALEKFYKNITITYFLVWYFGFPILFTIRFNCSFFIQEITINNLIEMGFYIGFFLFTFLSILGFISWIKERYVIFIICFIVCIFFYCPFLLFATFVLYGSPK
ncbi:hypothetical protein CQA44_10690 [Helicobacter sp. MIT 14-3879]|nr:hypothetical protein CQA44_10690 [Helicobacter sp. MIT 14-3879]